MQLDEINRSASLPRQAQLARRRLDQAYVFLTFLFLFALAAIIFVTVIQASPSTFPYGIGWFLGGDQASTSVRRVANDSPLIGDAGPDQIGFERRLYGLVNEARTERGLAPLKQDDSLTRAARRHSSDAATTHMLDVLDANGHTPVTRAEDAGFRPPQIVLEVVGAGFSTPEQVFNSWLENANSAAVILNSDVNEIGVGYAFARQDRTFRHYWTIDVGARGGLAFTVVVNNGAESTQSTQVVLHIGGKGWAQDMLISNEGDYAASIWEPYAAVKSWTISEGKGPKKIYVRLRGADGREVQVIGTIALEVNADGSGPGAGHNDMLPSPRPPLIRVPSGDLPLTGALPSGASLVLAVPASASAAPGYYQTSEYLLGKVAVGVVFPQCHGTVDKCSETWTSKMMDQVITQVTAGTNWWVQRMGGQLSFVYDQQREVATGYEPINHSQSDEGLWIGDVMTHLGFAGSTYFEQVYAYNNWMRQKYGTDWAFTIFVANSEKNVPGTFSNGYFAYSYVPGPFTVTTFDNDGYTINNMSSVIAHETGHIFGALDQYSGANVSCTATSGYLVFQNQNSQQGCSSNVDSIMRGGVVPYTNYLIDPFALGMVGGRVSVPGTLPDPINTTPVVTLNPVPRVTNRTNPTLTGTAQDRPYPSPLGNSVTINYISAVKYRVDGGKWMDASPSDGSPAFAKVSQGFAVTPSLSQGTHLIELQAFNRVNHASSITSATITVETNGAPVVEQPETIALSAPSPIPPSAAPEARRGVTVIRIDPGNNTLSVPFKGLSASSLISAINAQGGSATEIKSWTGRNWQGYVPGSDANDFRIEPGSGYMVKAQSPSIWTLPPDAPAIYQIKLNKGWVMLGAPYCADGATSCYTAATWAAALNAQGGGIVEIDRWVNGSWSAYQVGFPFNDFAVEAGHAYFVRTTALSTWTGR